VLLRRGGTEGDDLTRELEAGDVGRRTGRRRIATGALREVGPIQPGTVDPHDDLTRSGLWIGTHRDFDPTFGDDQRAHVTTLPHVAEAALTVIDDDGEKVVLDDDEAATLLALTSGLEPATTSACPSCRSRIVAAVALVDLLTDAPPVARGRELIELADDAPTLHLYVRDLRTRCDHRGWRDPGFEEWAEVMADLVDERGVAR